MDEFLRQLLGDNNGAIWLAGMIWSLIGVLLIKVYFYDRNTGKFNFKFWLNDNGRDVLLGIIISAIALRLGDYSLEFLRDKFGYNLGETSDFVGAMILISAFVQYKLHKKRHKLKAVKQ